MAADVSLDKLPRVLSLFQTQVRQASHTVNGRHPCKLFHECRRRQATLILNLGQRKQATPRPPISLLLLLWRRGVESFPIVHERLETAQRRFFFKVSPTPRGQESISQSVFFCRYASKHPKWLLSLQMDATTNRAPTGDVPSGNLSNTPPRAPSAFASTPRFPPFLCLTLFAVSVVSLFSPVQGLFRA